MKEYLPVATLLRLLGVLTICLAPHLIRLPLWLGGFVLALLIWRGVGAYRQWPMPRTAIKVMLTLLAGLGVVLQFGGISGQHAGTALLCVMVALKLMELKARRDVMVSVFLMYFLLLTHFLFSQELWTVAYLFTCTVLITALLIECQHLGALSPRLTLRKGGTMVAQALPLMLLLFVLFPRIPGPIWGLPSDAGAARSGLSDSMAPGDISQLIQSDEISFRVRFDEDVPPPAQRYWRGPSFDHFDGRSWEASATFDAAPRIDQRGASIGYEITLEPQRRTWLFALDMPLDTGLPTDARLTADGHLRSARPVIERRRYTLSSTPEYRLQPTLSERERRRTLRLPAGFNPRAAALAEQWRQQYADDGAIANAALRMFRQDAFVYTLRPPPLGRDSVDDFLFDTRRGFCEHYASAFTALMRAAGIPARVVTGYQGGQRNAIGDYYVVRQSDAHAWSEIWLENRGWVRIDPTAAVAPERIERGLESAIGSAEGLPGFLSARTRLRYVLEARWDWINAQWNGWVLAYGPELQQMLLERFGLDSMRNMLLTLTLSVTLVLAILGAGLLRQYAPTCTEDSALRAWQRLTRRLARHGYQQAAEEGPRDFIARVIKQRPDWGSVLGSALSAYLGLRYQTLEHADLTALLAAPRRLGAAPTKE